MNCSRSFAIVSFPHWPSWSAAGRGENFFFFVRVCVSEDALSGSLAGLSGGVSSALRFRQQCGSSGRQFDGRCNCPWRTLPSNQKASGWLALKANKKKGEKNGFIPWLVAPIEAEVTGKLSIKGFTSNVAFINCLVIVYFVTKVTEWNLNFFKKFPRLQGIKL